MYNKLKQELKERNLTVNKVAQLCGIHSQSIYPAVNGKHPFYPGWKKRIAEALDMPVKELFPDEEGVK